MKKKWRKGYRGSMTIEASYIFSLLWMVFYVVLVILFYYHDKDILQGAAYETAVAGREKCYTEAGMNEEELVVFGKERIAGKLIYFQEPDVEAMEDKDAVTVTTQVKKGPVRIKVTGRANITEPEEFMRQYTIELGGKKSE